MSERRYHNNKDKKYVLDNNDNCTAAPSSSHGSLRLLFLDGLHSEHSLITHKNLGHIIIISPRQSEPEHCLLIRLDESKGSVPVQFIGCSF